MDDVTEEQLLQAVLQLSLPLSLPFNAKTIPILEVLPVRAHVLVFYDASGSDDALLDAMLSIISAYKGRLLMVEASSEEYSLMHHFDIRLSDLPQVVIVDHSQQPYRYSLAHYLSQHQPSAPAAPASGTGFGFSVKLVAEEEAEEEVGYSFAAEEVHAFLQAYLAGQLSPTLRSELTTATAQSNKKSSSRVVNIVGSQFADL